MDVSPSPGGAGLVAVPLALPSPCTTCLRASREEPGAAAAGPAPSPGGRRGIEASPRQSRRVQGGLFTALPSPPPLAGCRVWGFFWKRDSACAFAQLRAPVTLIVASVQRDKNHIGELGRARCQQVTPPRSGFKSAFKGPRSKCGASLPETMRLSGGESQLAHVFLFSSY